MFSDNLENLALAGHLVQINFDQSLTSKQQDWLSIIENLMILPKASALRNKQLCLGRLCAAEALMTSGLDESLALNIAIGQNREPLWPNGYIGSISHDRIGAVAIANSTSKVRALGVDVEEWGRMKPEIAEKILHQNDLRDVPGLGQNELLTLIFSAKETLYKALYPIVQTYFGFDSASVTTIDLKRGQLTIELTRNLNHEFGVDFGSTFRVFWSQNKMRLITFLAILE